MSSIASVKRSCEQELYLIEGGKNKIEYQPFPDNFDDFCSSIKVNSGGRRVPFQLYDYQKRIHESIVENEVTQVVKTRQTGLSEEALFELAFNACTNPAFTGVFVSHREQKEVKSAAKKFRNICNEIEKVYGIKRSSTELYNPSFESGGQVLFRSGLDPENVVGESSVSMIVYDEAATYPFLEIMSYAQPAMAMLGDRARTIIICTPRLKTDDFGTTLLENNPIDLLALIEQVRTFKVDPVQEIVDEQGWHKFIVHWKAHPIYGSDPNFLEKQIQKSKNTEDEVRREFDLRFDVIGEVMFSFDLIEACCVGEWEKETIENSHYYMGIDPQFGGADFAVCAVIKHDLINDRFYLVDWYRKAFAELNYHLSQVSKLIKKYNPEAIALELNNGGGSWLSNLGRAYPDRFFKGVTTGGHNKSNMISDLIIEMEGDRLYMPDHPEIRKEFSVFEKKGSQLSAPAGKHDDIVMAMAIATNVLPAKVKIEKEVVDYDEEFWNAD